MNILVINAGSSSLKYQLLNPETGALLAKGLCERIGIDGKFTYKPQVEGKQVLDAVDVAMPTHSEAIQAVLNALVDKDNGVIGSMQEIDAVGHRVVHGGEAFAGSVLITDEVMKALEGVHIIANNLALDHIAEVFFHSLHSQNPLQELIVLGVPGEHADIAGIALVAAAAMSQSIQINQCHLISPPECGTPA